ncbi:MAG: hypothetical protein M3083_25575 [Actinomycetota bacterium]|nr:hypothetical protein [Actinomycetota bacterium]MDQ6947918.1 hypothetical protein [Actinomycetota bacterium]
MRKVDWTKVVAAHAPANPVYANRAYHAQLTGGSASVRGYDSALQTVGAGAREMLSKRPRCDGASAAADGIDVRIPGMVYGAARHCPTLGGTVASTPVKPAGALGVVNLGNAVAVVADATYGAQRAADSLAVSWKIPAGATSISDDQIAGQAG